MKFIVGTDYCSNCRVVFVELCENGYCLDCCRESPKPCESTVATVSQ